MRHTQLRAFHNVALSGGFSRAAGVLHLSQPAISEQVRGLETTYDISLFDRSHRSVRLTADGERLFEITKRLFDAQEAAREMLTERQSERAGTLRIHADSPHHILHILKLFRATHPKVSIQLRTGNSTAILSALKGYEADIAVIGEMPNERAFDKVALGASPLVAFARIGGPLDGLSTIPLQRLLMLPLVLREPGSKTRSKVEQAAGKLPIAIEAEGREAVREIVAAGGGVGIVSKAEYVADPRLTSAQITDPELTMEETVLCLRERSENRLISAFMGFAREAPRPPWLIKNSSNAE